MTGEVIEVGPDVEFLSEGDLVSVPFNVACGRCRNCRARRTDVCETTNPKVACGAYGFNLGDWTGGQAEYLFVPYADFQLLRFPDRDQAMAKIRDLALLSDILPTAFHGLMEAGAKPGSTVYIAGAGPVGRCGAAAARLLGASCIIVGDHNKDRLELVKKNGRETIDLSQDAALTDQIEAILGEPMVDCAVDYVGTEAHGIGREAEDMDPAYAINQVIDATRAGGATGVIGVYGPDPLAKSKAEQEGTYPIDFGKAWIKSPQITAGIERHAQHEGDQPRRRPRRLRDLRHGSGRKVHHQSPRPHSRLRPAPFRSGPQSPFGEAAGRSPALPAHQSTTGPEEPCGIRWDRTL
nr:alcohol dehydrogenase catalytic domain-containing protein [Streptomyces sp. DASNCL29]